MPDYFVDTVLFQLQVGVPGMVVFLNKEDQVDDAELLELVSDHQRSVNHSCAPVTFLCGAHIHSFAEISSFTLTVMLLEIRQTLMQLEVTRVKVPDPLSYMQSSRRPR